MNPQNSVTLSHRFIGVLDEKRDRLWAMGMAATAGTESQNVETATQAAVRQGKVEALLHTLVREGFSAVEKDPAADAWAATESAMAARGMTAAASEEAAAMPADVWSRLVATVQVEAARSAHTRAINPDSVLLSPDPLLAPKKSITSDDGDGFDLSPGSRFLLAALIAVVVGIGLTVYLLTRPGAPVGPTTASQKTPPHTPPATAPATAPALPLVAATHPMALPATTPVGAP